MYNESTYFKFELYTIHVGSINSFGGSKEYIASGFSLFLASSSLFRKTNFFYNIGTITNVIKNSIFFLFKQSFLQYLSNSP